MRRELAKDVEQQLKAELDHVKRGGKRNNYLAAVLRALGNCQGAKTEKEARSFLAGAIAYLQLDWEQSYDAEHN